MHKKYFNYRGLKNANFFLCIFLGMKNIVTATLLSAAMSFAANVQVLNPTGAEFAPDAPQMVQSIVRAAVSQSGNTPVESSGDVELRTNLMTMGSSIVVVCEQVKNGSVVKSSKQKAASIDDLDTAIEGAVAGALADLADASAGAMAAPEGTYQEYGPSTVYVVEENSGSKEDPNDNFAHKRPTRNYVSYGLGMSLWHNYDFDNIKCKDKDKTDCDGYSVDRVWDPAFAFHYARIFEVTPRAAITLLDNMDLSFEEDWELHETFLIGGRFFPSTGAVTPFIGLGLGLGIQFDNHYDEFEEAFAFGLATGAEAGFVFFRNSSVQLEVGAAWDVVWDAFDDFDRRFGAGTFYIAVNY